jgi:alanyl-tRNA synthetase
LWTGLFAARGLSTDVAELLTSERAAQSGNRGARINFYDESLCWWSRAGAPAGMPAGEPGGPDSEMFYLFPQVEHDEAFGANCHPHCDCGRFLEIGNSVFMEYRRTEEGFIALPQRNVDFGGGLERMCMAAADTPDVFRVDLLWPIVTRIESLVKTGYDERREPMRVIADHIRAIVFFALDGLDPSNTAQGYVMRRLARRALRKGLQLVQEADADRLGPLLPALVDPVVECYGGAYSSGRRSCSGRPSARGCASSRASRGPRSAARTCSPSSTPTGSRPSCRSRRRGRRRYRSRRDGRSVTSN